MSANNSTALPPLDDEDFPDLIEWQSEAQAVINDVKSHVKHVEVSAKLPSSRTHIYMNLTTLEDRRMCVLISTNGFQIVGDEYDEDVANRRADEEIYETPYALLGAVSAGYAHSFGGALAQALQKLM